MIGTCPMWGIWCACFEAHTPSTKRSTSGTCSTCILCGVCLMAQALSTSRFTLLGTLRNRNDGRKKIRCFGTQTPSTSRSTLLGTTKSQNRNDRVDFFWSGDLAICDLAISWDGTCPMWRIWEVCLFAQNHSTSRSTLLGTTKSQNRNDWLDFFLSVARLGFGRLIFF